MTGRFPMGFVVSIVAWLAVSIHGAQQSDGVVELDHPAIQYATRPPNDPIARLVRRIGSREVTLESSGPSGYLRSLLRALDVPVSSQIMVFSQGSLQASRINARNPRALYFSDSVAVGWVRGGLIEIAAQDPEQGTVFYTLSSALFGQPAINRSDRCLQCHYPFRTGGVPGMIEPGSHRRPLEQRWGGWYVTGQTGSIRHLGNVDLETLFKSPSTVNSASLSSLEKQFDTAGYLTSYSDIAALMVFEHQMQMMNVLTRLGWEARVARHTDKSNAWPATLKAHVERVVDYMLFVDEAPIAGRIRGSAGFAEAFSARGPHDRKGRSLRQLDLTTRLMRFPSSYMIYSEQFDSLPREAKSAVYERVWTILSGAERDAKYARLTAADRRAVIEILRETKKDLPEYFKPRL